MPRSQAIQEGRKLVLSCRTRSLPDVSYRWIKDDIEIPGANRSDLVLEPVRMQDFGRYFCRVWDKSGSLTSEPADVDVFPSPHMSRYGQWRIQESLSDLEALWESVAEHSVHRQSWINELDVTLDQVEIDRGDLVSRLITVSYFYLYQDKYNWL